MTPEERSIEIEKTRLSMGILPMSIVRQMKADDKKRAERAKQRANTRGSAVPEPLEIDDGATTTGRTTSSLTTATTTLTKVGIETPMTTTPVATATPTTITLSQPMMNKQRRRTAAKEKPPQVPSGFPVMLTGHARKHLKRERLPMFWSQSAQNTQLPSSWQKMVWIVLMRSKN